MKIKTLLIILVCMLGVIGQGCKEKKQEQDCGCDAEIKESIYNFEGMYEYYSDPGSSSYLYDSLNREYYEICNDSVVPDNINLLYDSLLNAHLIPSVWVVVDGEVGASCHFGFSFDAETITITSIKLKE